MGKELVWIACFSSSLLQLVNDSSVASIVTLVAIFLTAAIASIAATAVLGSIQGVSFFGFSVELSDWGKRFAAICLFFSVIFIATTLTGLGLILQIPLGIGILIEGLLVMMFGTGILQWGWGGTGD